MKKLLEGLTWHRRFITQLGAIKAGLEYLGRDISWPWLYGGTGWAFVINTQGRESDCSGPTCWRWQELFPLARNLGYEVETGVDVESAKAGELFPQRQREAWGFVRSRIDEGLPCFGWQLHPWIPDHYTIVGYDDVGYYYCGWTAEDKPAGPRPWQELGTTDVRVLAVFAVRPLPAPAPVVNVVRDALEAARKLADSPTGVIFAPKFASGPSAMENWAAGLDDGVTLRDHHAYVAQAWHECRCMAVEFLREAKARLPGRADAEFDVAARHYATVRDALTEAMRLSPDRPDPQRNWKDTFHCAPSAAILRGAAAAEREALGAAGAILSKLG
jgi:hypothetical protein